MGKCAAVPRICGIGDPATAQSPRLADMQTGATLAGAQGMRETGNWTPVGRFSGSFQFSFPYATLARSGAEALRALKAALLRLPRETAEAPGGGGERIGADLCHGLVQVADLDSFRQAGTGIMS